MNILSGSVKNKYIKNIIAVMMLTLSTTAQAFLVSDYSGNRVEIHDHVGNGRWTVVMLWQLECSLCEVQKPAIEAFHEKYKDTSGHVIGLVTDGHEYMPQIKTFINSNPKGFPSFVVFGDVFRQQIKEETGKRFPASPGYLVYSPDGELKIAIEHVIDIDLLVQHLETEMELL